MQAAPSGPPRCDEDDAWEWQYDQQYRCTASGSTVLQDEEQELDTNEVLYDLLAVQKQYRGPVVEGVTPTCTACGHSSTVPATAESLVLGRLLAGMGFSYDPVTDTVTPAHLQGVSQPGSVTAGVPGACACCGGHLELTRHAGPVAESVTRLAVPESLSAVLDDPGKSFAAAGDALCKSVTARAGSAVDGALDGLKSKSLAKMSGLLDDVIKITGEGVMCDLVYVMDVAFL